MGTRRLLFILTMDLVSQILMVARCLCRTVLRLSSKPFKHSGSGCSWVTQFLARLQFGPQIEAGPVLKNLKSKKLGPKRPRENNDLGV